MILPGISWSFLLLLFGLYEPVFGAIHELNWPIIVAFAAGGILGLASMARILIGRSKSRPGSKCPGRVNVGFQHSIVAFNHAPAEGMNLVGSDRSHCGRRRAVGTRTFGAITLLVLGGCASYSALPADRSQPAEKAQGAAFHPRQCRGRDSFGNSIPSPSRGYPVWHCVPFYLNPKAWPRLTALRPLLR